MILKRIAIPEERITLQEFRLRGATHRRRVGVKVLAVATIIAALAVPAFAQEDTAGSNKHHRAPKKTTEQPRIQADDKDYKSALDRLPQQKYDPWGTARSGGGDKPR
jgi:hypothetical protein